MYTKLDKSYDPKMIAEAMEYEGAQPRSDPTSTINEILDHLYEAMREPRTSQNNLQMAMKKLYESGLDASAAPDALRRAFSYYADPKDPLTKTMSQMIDMLIKWTFDPKTIQTFQQQQQPQQQQPQEHGGMSSIIKLIADGLSAGDEAKYHEAVGALRKMGIDLQTAWSNAQKILPQIANQSGVSLKQLQQAASNVFKYTFKGVQHSKTTSWDQPQSGEAQITYHGRQIQIQVPQNSPAGAGWTIKAGPGVIIFNGPQGEKTQVPAPWAATGQ